MTAMLCAAAVTAQFVGAKATRDALFLTSLDFTALPTMLMATAVCSIVLVSLYARGARTIAPARFVPASFIASGALFVAEWLLRTAAPAATAVVVYLHVSGAGPLLASGFWLIATERFDPRTAKRRFGQIAGAGSLGGLIGALLAERIAVLLGVPTMLLVLAACQFAAAWLVYHLAVDADAFNPASAGNAEQSHGSATSGLLVVAEAPHLRHLAALVLLGTTSAALLDYLFKATAVESFGRGDHLLRFFAFYYAGTSLITFVLQTSLSRAVLRRFGLALTTSTPSLALLAGGLGSMLAPGFGGLIVARAAESIFRGSWFRAGYELFYTPIPAAQKRAAKSVVDVGFDRLGEAVGGGLVRLAMLVPSGQASAILWLAMICSAGAVFAASRLNRWYLRTLENSLIDRAGAIDLSETSDGSTRAVVRSIRRRKRASASDTARVDSEHAGLSAGDVVAADPLLRDIVALRSRDRGRVMEVLARDEGLPATLVPHVIPLLAWDQVANYALFALRKVAEEHVGELMDALLDPGQDLAVRRRLARIFSVCVSERAANAVMLALDDARFDVRFQAARSLAAILDKNPRIHVDRERIFEVVLREVAVSRPVWESRRLLDPVIRESALDEFVRDRASQSLTHVFTLLSVALPREPLQIAFRSLHSEDRHLRGTALEYLEGTLPPPIRQHLWPFLVRRPAIQPARGRDEIIAELLRSSESLTLRHIATGWSPPRAV
jgi:hypothetical protein